MSFFLLSFHRPEHGLDLHCRFIETLPLEGPHLVLSWPSGVLNIVSDFWATDHYKYEQSIFEGFSSHLLFSAGLEYWSVNWGDMRSVSLLHILHCAWYKGSHFIKMFLFLTSFFQYCFCLEAMIGRRMNPTCVVIPSQICVSKYHRKFVKEEK